MTLNTLSDTQNVSTSIIKIFVFFLLLLNTVCTSAQDYLLIKEKGKYYHNGQEYKCKELGQVYRESEEALKWYNKGRRNLRVATYLSFGGLALGGVAYGIGSSAEDLGALAVIALLLGVGLIVELVAVVFALRGSGKLKRAREEFNFDMLEKFGLQSDMSLTFGGTKNGVGLILQF